MTPTTNKVTSIRDKALACTVASFVPFTIQEQKPGLFPGKFDIPASDTKTPQVIHIKNSIHYVYLDDTRGSIIARDPSDEVAASICNDFINSQLGLKDDARPALLWFPGALNVAEIMEEYKAECLKAKQFQYNWFVELVKIADDDWQRYHKHTVISDFQRKIANIMGLSPEKHEWMSEQVFEAQNSPAPKLCVACKSAIHADAAVCPVCRAIQNVDKAKNFNFAS